MKSVMKLMKSTSLTILILIAGIYGCNKYEALTWPKRSFEDRFLTSIDDVQELRGDRRAGWFGYDVYLRFKGPIFTKLRESEKFQKQECQKEDITSFKEKFIDDVESLKNEEELVCIYYRNNTTTPIKFEVLMTTSKGFYFYRGMEAR